MFRTVLNLQRLENREAPTGIQPVNPVDQPGGPPAPVGDPGQTPPPAGSEPVVPVGGPVL